MIEIVLVRHGQPDWEPGGRAVSNPSLTPRGRAEAEAFGRSLEGQHFDAFYVSPLIRARETAEPAAGVLGMEPTVLEWLEEIRLPDHLEGSPADEVHRYLEQAQARDLYEWWEGMPGGEPFRHFNERVAAGLETLLTGEHRARLKDRGPYSLWHLPDKEQRILMVCHMGTIAVAVSYLLGIEPVPWVWERFSIDWAGMAVVRSNCVAGGTIWSLRAFNRTDYLRGVVPAGTESVGHG